MERVLVGMSGGVDSAAAAFLLSEEGYSVEGATLVLHGFSSCGDDAENAALAASRMGIPFGVVHGEEEFKKAVISPFASGYAAGDTPNPCVLCNVGAKLPLLLAEADRRGIKYIATGHYVKKGFDEVSGRYYLAAADDDKKDQSYVLYTLGQEMLSRMLFPLGDKNKEALRTLMNERGLVPAERPESQDICFIPDGDYAEFLKRECGVVTTSGDFIRPDGTKLGRHKGLLHYTLGQRRGLGISDAARLFVISKNKETNTITLGAPELLYSSRCTVHDINWMAIAPPEGSVCAKVRTRYRQPLQDAVITPTGERDAVVEFLSPQRAVTPGQSAVFYSSNVVLGGGIIG